jgi:hypothetical protein
MSVCLRPGAAIRIHDFDFSEADGRFIDAKKSEY